MPGESPIALLLTLIRTAASNYADLDGPLFRSCDGLLVIYEQTVTRTEV